MKKIVIKCKMVISIISILLIFASCSLRECSPIERKIKDICVQADTIYAIPLNSLTDFDWEELYIMSGPRFPDEVEEVIGVKYEKIIPDNCYRFIFLNNNKIVNEYSSSCNGIDLDTFWKRKEYTKYYYSSTVYIKTILDEGNLYLRAIPHSNIR